MGQLLSGPYHRSELQMRKNTPILEYHPQPPEEIMQLDTEVDQKGNTTVDHMFKPTREVYGQKARDLSNRVLDWHDYGIDLKKRPSPYDFPAFERDERITENRQTTTTQEVSGKQHGQANEKQTEAAKNATVGASGKDVTDSKGPAKNPDGIGSKKESAFKRNRRLSHNREMDECSLEGN